MTGKQKILDLIRADGENGVKQINEQSAAKVKEIAEQGQKDAEQVSSEILAAAEAECGKIRKNAQSARASATKKAMLKCRREQIDATLKQAIDKLCSLPDGEYFECILKLAKGYQNLGGEIVFSATDLARMPADMQARLNGVGVTSVISDKAADINGGFIIKCGDVEYAADFASVAEEKREQLEDMINRSLFAE